MSLFASMVSTAGAMRTLQSSLSVVQNNIVNASTPGFARQQATLSANPFDANAGLPGGVSFGPTISTRDSFAEASVWKTQHRAGYSAGLSAELTEIERTFPLTAGAGIPGELDRFFASVSQWSISPNSTVARSHVLDRAAGLARSFNETAINLGEVAARASSGLLSTVERINRLTADIVSINRQRRETFANAGDSGLDASLHTKLEELAGLVDFTALPQEDGSVSIYIGGQTAAVIGDRQWPISLATGANSYQILDASGGDITGTVQGGKLGGLLEFRNNLVPGYQTRLNTLAQGIADSVNGVLNAGLDQDGNTPVKNLFSYDPLLGAAFTLTITDMTAPELAAAAAGDPGGNTNALDLADLSSAGLFAGLSASQYYAELTRDAGDRLNAEKSNGSLQNQLLQQAESVRSALSGVDINTEAAKILELQKGFQACGQVMSVLNGLTETLIAMLR